MRHHLSTLSFLWLMAEIALGHGRADTDWEIRNKLSLYAIRLDTKQFGLLDEIFTSDVVANYGLPGTVGTYYGLIAVENFLKSNLPLNVVTQHAITTIVIDVRDESTPISVSYVTANYYGQGNLTGQAVAISASYRDQWTKDGRSWKLKHRTASYVVSHSIFLLITWAQICSYVPVAWWYYWERCTYPANSWMIHQRDSRMASNSSRSGRFQYSIKVYTII